VILQQDTFEPVVRSRVMELLARVTRRRIALVVAPAGYGKSVAVSQFLSRADVPNVWFVVRDEHAKLLSFAWGLAHSLANEAPGLERGLLAAYQGAAAEPDPPAALAIWFAAHLDDCARTVVVDDLHLGLEEAHVRNFIVALIKRAPAGVRWMLLSRSALDLPLATWLAYGHSGEPVDVDDLRVRPVEAAEIARACGVDLGAERLGELLALTGGWPAAFIFALRAAARGTELGRIAVETREKLYAYLADQAFGALSQREQHFLLGTALLPVVDLELLVQAGWDEPEATYRRLRRHAGFIVPEGTTTFHYHDLFRDFLHHRLRMNGPASYRRTQLASADIAEAAERADWALRLRVAADDPAGVVRMLREQAPKRTLNGMVDAIEEALHSLPQALLRGDPVLLGLLARTLVLHNAYEESDTLYQSAIELAGTADLRAELSMSLAGSLYNRMRQGAAFSVLSDLDANEIADVSTRARLLSRVALYRAMRREFEEAERLATQALAAMVFGDLDSRGEVLYLACLVSDFSNRVAEARSRATEALKIAEQAGNSSLIARCCHLLCFFAMNEGDWAGAADLLAAITFHATREGDLTVVHRALQTILALAPMRGDGAGIAEAEAALGGGFEAYADYDCERSFARAMRCAWAGDFAAARSEAEIGLQTRAGDLPSYKILALPNLAVYQAAVGDRAASVAAIDRATTVLTEFVAGAAPGTHATFASIGRIMLAVASALSSRSRAANQMLSHVDQCNPAAIPAVKLLAQAARTFNRVAQGVADRAALERDLAAVRDAGLGGYADLLAALPAGVARSAATFGTLTKAELQMLRLIARGGTMKAIAVELNRSPDTVETHVRAILRKLGCKSRSEAVALARDHGIL